MIRRDLRPSLPRRIAVSVGAILLAAAAVGAGQDAEPPARPPALPEPEGAWWTPTAEQRTHAERTQQPLWFEDAQGMRFVLIPPGTFTMGSPASEVGRDGRETLHQVTLTQGFYLGATEVTNAQFRRFRAGHDSTSFQRGSSPTLSLNGDSQPAVIVSWNDAEAYMQWLNQQAGETGLYRLPTEAEWEYACRAGASTVYFWGNGTAEASSFCNARDSATQSQLGWSGDNAFPNDDGYRVAAPVGSYQPNAFGLRDMIGNVWEWCADWHEDYPSTSVQDPTGASTGQYRVLRGGSWSDVPWICRAAYRVGIVPGDRHDSIGFRVAVRGPARARSPR